VRVRLCTNGTCSVSRYVIREGEKTEGGEAIFSVKGGDVGHCVLEWGACRKKGGGRISVARKSVSSSKSGSRNRAEKIPSMFNVLNH